MHDHIKQWIQAAYGLWLPKWRQSQNGQMEQQRPPLKEQEKEQERDWEAYWEAHGQPWRTEPEIAVARQQFLLQRLAAEDDDSDQKTSPFQNIPLTRADIEWLVKRQEEGHCLTNGSKKKPWSGIDVQGAILNGVNLHALKLKDANFSKVQLEGADFRKAQLEGAGFIEAQLKGASFKEAQLKGASFRKAQLEGANFVEAQLEGANFWEAQLEEACFLGAQLKEVGFLGAQLEGADFMEAQLEGADFLKAQLKGTDFRRANIANAQFEGAMLVTPQGVGPLFADSTGWNDVHLSVIEWPQIKILGEEAEARRKTHPWGAIKEKAGRLEDYRAATRAYRQLATALEGQGLKEEAESFAYRAYVMQRKVHYWSLRQNTLHFWQRVGHLRAWLFSWLLSLLSGYGYRFGRSLMCYLSVLLSFAVLYVYLSQNVPPHSSIPDHLSWLDAAILSVSDMVGRGFFRQDITLSDPFAGWSVLEGLIGVFVDVLLISTLTQRLFKK